MKYQCPSCGANVEFRSKATVSLTCGYCQSVLVRHDANLELIGKVAELFDDVTPLQVRASGRVPEGSFALLGRVRWKWSDGAWNEWFMSFNNGKTGWLAEAQGSYSACVEKKATPTSLPPLVELSPGKQVQIDGTVYEVDDIKKAEAHALEGEMPVVVKPGTRKITVDMSDKEGRYACLEYSDDGVRLYVGRHYDLAELKLTGLRRVNLKNRGGDSGSAASLASPGKTSGVRAFSCPSCGGSVQLRTGEAVSAACGSCKSIIDVSDANLSILSRAAKARSYKPFLKLGSVGHLHGEDYTIIGYLRRCDETEMYEWDEYLLYSPTQGFRWLMEFRGHWNVIRNTKQKPQVSGKNANYLGRSYALYLKGKAKVIYVEGEFYWRVKHGETVKVEDYVRPPGVLSKEEASDEITWSSGEYTPSSVIKESFKVKETMPLAVGVAPNQPSPSGVDAGKLFGRFGLFFALLTLIQCTGYIASGNKRVFDADFDPARTAATAPSKSPGTDAAASELKKLLEDLGADTTIKSPNAGGAAFRSDTFEVPGGIGNLEITTSADVQNQWMEVGYTLIDEKTGATTSFEQGVEYYYGSDSGGSWSEGSKSTTTTLSSIPGGRYYLLIQPVMQAGQNMKSFHVSVTRDAPDSSNYLWIMAMMILVPFFSIFRHMSHEVSRWSDSEYSPYSNE